MKDVRSEKHWQSRNSLITKKDINNIKVTLDESSSLPDEISVNAFLAEFAKKGHLVLLYKEQNVQHADLQKNIFFLSFMFSEQIKMFGKFGSDRICIDATHGLTGYDFELVTLMVLDEFEEGFPVAFCLTSTVSFQTMKVFF